MVKLFRSGALGIGFGPVLLMAAIFQTACGLDRQVLYGRGDLQVGLQHDPTTDAIGLGDMGSGPASPRNDHPYAFSQTELRQLLGSLSIAALDNDTQQSRHLDAPLFRADELNKLVPWLTSAFSRASRTDRVFFSLASTPFPSPGGRTMGTLFVRHRYLHVALKPFVLPVEGETTQIAGRSMTIKAAEPVQEVFVEGSGAQLWTKSDTMHISLRIPEEFPSDLSVSQSVEAMETSDQGGRTEGASAQTNTETARENNDKALQRQVEDLAVALKELQARIAGQANELESVKAEMKRLQEQSADKARARMPGTSPVE
ncbi:MAG: hypothetical protein OJF51_000075 [Nitrospira sp.]|nr:MAG: hypothetical protein OJF51_000075 [Nitrospira sp.]